MSDHVHAFPIAVPRALPHAAGIGPIKTLAVAVLAAILTVLVMREALVGTWTAGAFIDTDDAMRLVQVRALLQGQAWFDMTARALDPPTGTFMHWSRIVDVPIALLIKGFGLFTDSTHAERLARIAFPFGLLVAFYVGIARLADLLLGPVAKIPAIAAAVMSGNGIIQFVPGRIDHHAPRIVAMVFMLAAIFAALDPRRARQAAVGGGLAALSLSISLESLPFIAFMVIGVIGLWIWKGAPMRRMLAWFAAGLAIGLPLFFVATVGPSRYWLPVCDAFGAAHLGAGLIGAAGCACFAFAQARLSTWMARLAAATLVAALAGGFVAIAFPACLDDPFAAVDPLVRSIWLANVQESLSVAKLFVRQPVTALVSLVPVVLGVAGCLFAIAIHRGVHRDRFIVLTSVVMIGLALAFWQVRTFTTIAALASLGGVAVAMAVRDRCLARGRDTLASLAFALILPFSANGVELVVDAYPSPLLATDGPTKDGPTKDEGTTTRSNCLAPSALAPLNALAPGLALAPVDAGSFLLADTHLSVLAAAFHRDNAGNRFAFDTMLADPSAGEALAVGRGITYVLICPGLTETDRLAARAPRGLAAALIAGRIPDWLRRVPIAGTPYRVFRVSPRP